MARMAYMTNQCMTQIPAYIHSCPSSSVHVCGIFILIAIKTKPSVHTNVCIWWRRKSDENVWAKWNIEWQMYVCVRIDRKRNELVKMKKKKHGRCRGGRCISREKTTTRTTEYKQQQHRKLHKRITISKAFIRRSNMNGATYVSCTENAKSNTQQTNKCEWVKNGDEITTEALENT